MLVIALASRPSHVTGTYKLLASGKYALDLKHGMYWIWVFPKWTSLGLMKEASNPAVNVTVRDKNGVEQGFISFDLKDKYPYSVGSTFGCQDSKHHGYALAWFDVKAAGKYIVEYKTDYPCLLMFAPVSAVHRNLAGYNVIDGIDDDHLETPVER